MQAAEERIVVFVKVGMIPVSEINLRALNSRLACAVARPRASRLHARVLSFNVG